MPDKYDLTKIRRLLIDGFDERDLRYSLCYYETAFRQVYDNLAQGTGKAEIADRLIEYARQKLLLDKLLEWANKENPRKYDEFRPYDLPVKPSTPSPPSPIRVERKPTLAFEIKISPYGPASYKAEINSPAGQTTATFRFPLKKQVIEATLDDFRKNLQTTTLRSAQDETYVPQIEGALTPEQIGAALFNSVFRPNVLDLYKASRQQAKLKGQPLPIIFNIDPQASDLINLPWEFLYDATTQRARGRFLAFDKDTPIIRRCLMAEPFNFSYDPPLRVLLVSAIPEGSALLNVQREHSLINDKLTSLNQGGQTKVRVEYLSAASLPKLKQIVRDEKRTPHIIHFMGHGSLGNLLLEDREGGQKSVSEESLAIVLRNAPSLRLVVLNACKTAQTDFLTRQQLGVAQSLADAGILAVVAMQFAVSDKAALTFAEEFYQVIAEGRPIDSAVTWGRIAIQNEFANSATKEWATPVLYLQSPVGNILADLLGEPQEIQKKEPESLGIAPVKLTTAPGQDDTTPTSKTAQERRKAEEIADQIEHLLKLRHKHIQRLRKREEQATTFGINTDPAITIEIANIRDEIKEIEQNLKRLDPEITFTEIMPPPPATPAVDLRGIDDSKLVRVIKKDESGIHSQAFNLYKQGQVALDRGDWAQALSCLSRAQKLSPGLPDVNNLTEQARRQWLQMPGGEEEFYALEALYDQAQHLKQNNLERATSLFEKIMRIDAGYRDVYDLALETRMQANKERAEREKQTKLKDLYAQAQARLKEENWSGAIEILNQIIELDERYPDAQTLLAEATRQRDLLAAYQEGELHFKKGDWAKAVAAFGKVTSIDKGYRDANKLLSLSRRQKQLDAWLQEAEEYLKQHDWEAAIEVLAENRVADEREEARVALNYAYAHRYYQERNWAQVVKHLKEVIEARPNYRPDLEELYQQATEELHLQQQFARAVAYIEQGEWPAAKATLDSLVQTRPDYPMVQERLQQVNQEIRLADLYQKARSAIELKQWARAISFLKEIPGHEDADQLLAEAKKQLEIAAFFKDGLEAAGSGRWAEAVAALSRVIELDPDNQEAQQQLQSAVDKVTLERDFSRGMQALQVRRQNYNLERLNEAVNCLETVARIDPRYRGAGNLLREAKRERLLLQHYQEGEAAYQQEQWAKAVEHWQVIVKDENEPEYHGDAGRRLAEARRRQRLAELYLEANLHLRKEEWNNAMMLLEELQQEAAGEVYKDIDKLLAEAKLQQELLNHYQQAQQLMAAEQWEQATSRLGQIQAKQPTYRQSEVERMSDEAQTNREATRHYQAGLEALKAENWAEAVTHFGEVFNLKPDFHDISTRLQQAKKQETLHQCYQAAMQAMAAEAWDEAIDRLVAIQGLDPSFRDAGEQLNEAERQKQLAADYQTALAHFEAERWAEARDALADILARRKDYKEAKQRRDEAQQQLDMADKYAQALEKIEQAKDRPENWQLVVDLLTPVVAWRTDYQEADARLDEAKRQARLYDLYQRATVLGAKGEIPDLQQAIKLLGQITKVDLNYRDAASLKAEYEAALAKKKEEKRRLDIKTRYDLAVERAGKGNFDQVVDLLTQIISFDKTYQAVCDEVAQVIQECQNKYDLGQQLKAKRKINEARAILEDYQQERVKLPARIQAILKQNAPK